MRPKQNTGLLSVVEEQKRAPQHEEKLQRDSEASTRLLKHSRYPKNSSQAKIRLLEQSTALEGCEDVYMVKKCLWGRREESGGVPRRLEDV